MNRDCTAREIEAIGDVSIRIAGVLDFIWGKLASMGGIAWGELGMAGAFLLGNCIWGFGVWG